MHRTITHTVIDEQILNSKIIRVECIMFITFYNNYIVSNAAFDYTVFIL